MRSLWLKIHTTGAEVAGGEDNTSQSQDAVCYTLESFVQSIDGRWITTVVVAQVSNLNRVGIDFARSMAFALQ